MPSAAFSLRVLALTWNVGNAAPPADLRPLLGVGGPWDIVAVALQEVPNKLDRVEGAFRKAALVIGGGDKADKGDKPDRTEPAQGHLRECRRKGIAERRGLCGDRIVPPRQRKSASDYYRPRLPERDVGDRAQLKPLERRKARLASYENDEEYDGGTGLGGGGGKWKSRLKEQLGDRYVYVHGDKLGAMRIIVFVSRSLSRWVRDVRTMHVATGFADRGTNKGAVALSFLVMDTSICFICAHLAAHEGPKYLRERFIDYQQIVRRLEPDQPSSSPASNSSTANIPFFHRFDTTFLMGDLNFRLTPPHKTQHQRLRYLLSKIDTQDYPALTKYDELLHHIGRRHILAGFQEAPITFPPSFKFTPADSRLPTAAYNLVRLPAYCDRILHHALPNRRPFVRQTAYSSAPVYTISDHKPVRAAFDLIIPEALPRPVIADPHTLRVCLDFHLIRLRRGFGKELTRKELSKRKLPPRRNNSEKRPSVPTTTITTTTSAATLASRLPRLSCSAMSAAGQSPYEQEREVIWEEHDSEDEDEDEDEDHGEPEEAVSNALNAREMALEGKRGKLARSEGRVTSSSSGKSNSSSGKSNSSSGKSNSSSGKSNSSSGHSNRAARAAERYARPRMASGPLKRDSISSQTGKKASALAREVRMEIRGHSGVFLRTGRVYKATIPKRTDGLREQSAKSLPCIPLCPMASLRDLKYAHVVLSFPKPTHKLGASGVLPLGELTPGQDFRFEMNLTKYGRPVGVMEAVVKLVVNKYAWTDSSGRMLKVPDGRSLRGGKVARKAAKIAARAAAAVAAG